MPSPQRRATIMDVARAAQVSRQTVSNVVNRPDRVAPQTLERVSREIERLGFRTNVAARSLRHRRTHALGIELNSLGVRRLGSILDEFLVELTVASRAHESHLVPFAAASHDHPLPAYQDMLAHQLVDGFLLTDTRHNDPRPEWLQLRDIPFTAFGRLWDDPSFTRFVDVDGYGGVVAAVRHLQQQGYRRTAFLGWPVGSPVGDDRRAGWQHAAGLDDAQAATLCASATQDMSRAAEAVGPLLDRLGPGGAVVCASDTLAVGVWSVLRDRGLRPGADVGLVGFDDTDLASAFGITSLRQPLHAVAETVLRLMDEARAGRPMPDQGVLLRPRLVARASTQPHPPHTRAFTA
ncbi:MAG TPA: LacI family DNA-binding transcriptional regulator [Dermatophilaceae bacterium]|nr:LacI family DNA-binding transcriptional regulator [Dermatophilaceae bacterium]